MGISLIESKFINENYLEVDFHTQALLEQIGSVKNPYISTYRGIELIVFPRIFFSITLLLKIKWGN